MKIYEINSVTFREWIELRSSLASIYNQNFNCSKCKARFRAELKDRENSYRAAKGCFGVLKTAIASIDGASFYTCPGNFVREWAFAYLESYSFFLNGVLPFSGSLMEQPTKILEIFRVIQAFKNERMMEDAKRERELAKRGRQ